MRHRAYTARPKGDHNGENLITSGIERDVVYTIEYICDQDDVRGQSDRGAGASSETRAAVVCRRDGARWRGGGRDGGVRRQVPARRDSEQGPEEALACGRPVPAEHGSPALCVLRVFCSGVCVAQGATVCARSWRAAQQEGSAEADLAIG